MALMASEEVSGEIYVSPPLEEEEEEGTLDEPVSVTLKRDLRAILRKCVHVVVPVRSNKALLHDCETPLVWDLWGPLLLCISMALLLHGHSKDLSDHTIHFIDVFLIVWGGAAVVTVNAQLLRGKVSFFQSVCTLGYCLLPLATSLLISRILLTFLPSHSNLVFSLRLSIIALAFLWSMWASLGFLSDYLPEDRKALAIYPIVLFYFGISCLILTQNTPFI